MGEKLSVAGKKMEQDRVESVEIGTGMSEKAQEMKRFSSNYSQTILEVWFQRILHYTDRFNLTRFCFASSTNVYFFFFSLFGGDGGCRTKDTYLLHAFNIGPHQIDHCLASGRQWKPT